MITMRVRSSRVILTYGRFDLFHQDHIRFLRQVAGLGGELIVGCATDEHAEAIGWPCTMPYESRRAVLERCRFVSRVIPEMDSDQKRTDIVNYNVAALAMGKDQAGKLDHLQDIAQVLYLPRLSARRSGIARPLRQKVRIAG